LDPFFMKAQGYDVKDNVLFQDKKFYSFREKMERLRAANAKNTSTFGISLSPIELTSKKCP
jgi:hypothetical protein